MKTFPPASSCACSTAVSSRAGTPAAAGTATSAAPMQQMIPTSFTSTPSWTEGMLSGACRVADKCWVSLRDRAAVIVTGGAWMLFGAPLRRELRSGLSTLRGSLSASTRKGPFQGLSRADDGIRTHDLLHGKQTL